MGGNWGRGKRVERADFAPVLTNCSISLSYRDFVKTGAISTLSTLFFVKEKNLSKRSINLLKHLHCLGLLSFLVFSIFWSSSFFGLLQNRKKILNLILLQVGEELARKSEASPEGACERACERGEKYLKSRGRKIRPGSIGQAGVYTLTHTQASSSLISSLCSSVGDACAALSWACCCCCR